MFSSIVASPRSTLSPQQALELAKVYLENARNARDIKISLVLCHDTEVSLYQAKKAVKGTKDNAVQDGIATTYTDLGVLLHGLDCQREAKASFEKAQKLGAPPCDPGRLVLHRRSSSATSFISLSVPASDVFAAASLSAPHSRPYPDAFKSNRDILPSGSSAPQTDNIAILQGDTTTAPPAKFSSAPVNDILEGPLEDKRTTSDGDTVTIPLNIFVGNVRPPAIMFKPPETDERLSDTLQLAYCLGLLQVATLVEHITDPVVHNWLQATTANQDEQERLKAMARNVVRAFKRDELKDSKAVTEVVYLAPVLEKEDFQYLLREFYSGIGNSELLDVHQLEGLAQLIQGADRNFVEANDLVKILELLGLRLKSTHSQSPTQLYKLALTVSHVLDAMADAGVKDLDRVNLHEPLSSYLDALKKSPDSYLVYQAAYASQALLYVPDDESLGKAALRRTGKVIQGISGLVSAVKGLDFNGLIEGLQNIQSGFSGAGKVVGTIKTAYDKAMSLTEGGEGFMKGLKEGFSFDRKCAWYPALRGADALIRNGQFAKFKRLVCESPCRHGQAFQWGVCQRLRDIASNPMWDINNRRSAVSFLGEIYQKDAEWGHHPTIKQWILNILMQLSALSSDDMQSHHMLTVVDSMLEELGKHGDRKKQTLYRMCREEGPGSFPLKIALPAIGSPSLLDRVQERLDVEGTLRQLRKQRLKERDKAVYIPPQAKPSLQAQDSERSCLMGSVEKSMEAGRKVFLILGDSGSGKSTFNRELECQLWRKYEKNGAIPLHINLPAIDKPEHEMIAKQLRKAEFTEPQIRELKQHRRFIIICDGYDESQQTRNLYTSNHLNEPGEWNAMMIISCRSEYLGIDYRDRFQPSDRNYRADQTFFEEAVITPFSWHQVTAYIDQYVSVYQPLWRVQEYRDALELIPSMKELVKNPFLMSLSLEVLPRMVDPGQGLSSAYITRVALYDHFIEHWFERGKKRLGEKKLSSHSRAAFESLIDEGFTPSGIDFLRRMSVAIYKEQDGQPIVQYSRYRDEGSWKTAFFSREDEKQLLREACPLIRSGNQHRFIHRSLLEYGVALAIFDPQDWRGSITLVTPTSRIESTDTLTHTTPENPSTESSLCSDLKSPLAWRSFVNDHSVLQFLEERVQQHPVFKQQLLDYIEHSKTDKRWRIAASNAITILVRAGVSFLRANLQGVQIPGADLSGGMFESANLQGSDLTGVNLRGVCLPQANLNEAQLSGVQFGELPYLAHTSSIESMTYSPDGKTFAIGLNGGKINMYSTSNWDELWTRESEHFHMIVYSPNSRQLASTSNYESTVLLWNTETGDHLRTLTGHDDVVNCVTYAPKRGHIATGSKDKTLRLWDTGTGEVINTLVGHTSSVLHVTFVPNGDQLASCSHDGTIRLWDVQAGVCSSVLDGHSSPVQCVMYSSQGDMVISGSEDMTVRLWSTETGECLQTFSGHEKPVTFATFLPKGNLIASASEDDTVRVWDIESGQLRHNFGDFRSPNRLYRDATIYPRDALIACVGGDMTVRLWDAETGICRQTLSGHSKDITDIRVSPGGDQVASSDEGKTVRLWSMEASTYLNASTGHRGLVAEILVSPDGNQPTSCSVDGDIRVWDLETGFCRRTLSGHVGMVYCIAYEPTGKILASGGEEKTVRLWNVESGTCDKTLEGHTDAVWSVAYSPDGSRLISGSIDHTARLWDLESGECSFVLSGHEDWVRCVAYSPQGNKAASSSDDHSVRLWDSETGDCLHVLNGNKPDTRSIVFSATGDQIASAGDDFTVNLWSVETGNRVHALSGHTNDVTSVTYSPKGNTIASASDDKTVRLWDVETGESIHNFTGHGDTVGFAVFSPKGDTIASCSADKTVRLWDPTSGQCCATIQVFQSVYRVAWNTTSDANYLIAGCWDGSMGSWRLPSGGDYRDMQLSWKATSGTLVVDETSVQDAQGLSPPNKRLMEQRGAVGEPLRGTAKVVDVASAVSKSQSQPSSHADDLS